MHELNLKFLWVLQRNCKIRIIHQATDNLIMISISQIPQNRTVLTAAISVKELDLNRSTPLAKITNVICLTNQTTSSKEYAQRIILLHMEKIS